MQFKDLKLKPFIQKALDELHFENLTEVQTQVIPAARLGENLIVQSQTGSGKTHSFLIPIIEQIDSTKPEVQAVITAPSRELAEQLYQVAEQLVKYSDQPIRVENYIGGTDKKRQISRLSADNQPQIVIGTPGRIFDLMSENALWVQTATTLVVDEADMTMDLGFLNIVDEIASRMAEDLHMMVFSATIPQSLEVFLNKYMTKPTEITIQPQEILANTIDNYLISTKGRSRKELALNLLTIGFPYLAIIFTNTKKYANEVSDYLKEAGLKVATIHGDVPARERKRIMRQVRDLEYQYVVATDLAARGIDIPGVSMIINIELPQDLEYFIHRVGRTGRNELKGTAYTFVTPDDDSDIQALEARGIEFQTVELKDDEIVPSKDRHQRVQRKDTVQDKEDSNVRGMINRNKKRKVKPGYKRKLDRQIKEYRFEQGKQKERQSNRAVRNKNKRKGK